MSIDGELCFNIGVAAPLDANEAEKMTWWVAAALFCCFQTTFPREGATEGPLMLQGCPPRLCGAALGGWTRCSL